MIVFLHYIKENIILSPARKNKRIVVSLLVSLLLNLFLWGGLYYSMIHMAGSDQVRVIPLHYNIFIGIDLIGQWYNVFIFPALGLFVLIINSILAFLLYPEKDLLCYFLSFFTLVIQLILLLAALFVVLINI